MNWLSYYKSNNMAKADIVLDKMRIGRHVHPFEELPYRGHFSQKVVTPFFDSHVLLRQENRTLTHKFYDLLYNRVAQFLGTRPL